MKRYNREKIQSALRKLGFRRIAGSGGHEVWEDNQGRRVRPSFHKRDVSEGAIFSFVEALEGMGVCERSEFRRLVKGRKS